MDVYAQPTDINDRVCSLMSAVLNRSIRPEFSQAIEDKASLLVSNAPDNKRHLGIIFLGPQRDAEELAELSKKFERRYSLDTATIPTPSLPHSSLETMKNLQKTIHFFSRTNRAVVLVAIRPSDVDLIYRLLFSQYHAESDTRAKSFSSTRLMDNILGVITLHPIHCEMMQFFSFPLFMVLKPSLLRTTLKSHIADPSCVVVEHEIDWSSDSHWIWLARTIAKYTEAVAQIRENVLSQQNVQEDSRSIRPPSASMRSRL